MNPMLRWLLILFATLGGLFIVRFYLRNRTNGRIVSGGRLRRYLLYVPDSYEPAHPAPLVVCLHGFVQWAAHQQGLSGWNALAEDHGFLVVYPQGTGFPLRWHVQSSAEGREKREGDLRFIAELLDQLCRTYSIDKARIYVNGMSNGGGMALLLACRMAERIAAAGGVAGAYLHQPAPHEPGRSMPLIAFHGTDDPIVPYRGAPARGGRHAYAFPAIEDWAAGWAARNGCATTPVETRPAEDVSALRYTGCRAGAEVVLYAIEGGGHTWPGGAPLPRWLTGQTSMGVDATALMWDFFCQFPRDTS